MFVRSVETKKLYNINLLKLDDSVKPPKGVEIFDALETTFPKTYRYRDDKTGAVLAPQANIDILLEYWRAEVDAWNNGRFSVALGDPANEPTVKYMFDADVMYPPITPDQFAFALKSIEQYDNYRAYIDDISEADIWLGDSGKPHSVAVPESARRSILVNLWNIVHMPFLSIRAATSLSRADFAAAFAIPPRTLYRWERDETPCPICTKLLLAHAVGLYKYPCPPTGSVGR